MDCKFLGRCGSCNVVSQYEIQLKNKFDYILYEFSEFFGVNFGDKIDIFPSKSSGYRIRAEFKIYHENNQISYAMSGKNERFVKIDKCLKVDEKIAHLMPEILSEISANEMLKNKIFGINFLATKFQLQATLLYHKDILSIEKDLFELSKKLGISIVARARKQRIIAGDENLIEELDIAGKKFRYIVNENSFLQPNRLINEKMILWAKNCLKKSNDLLEMYCGHGNFSIVLAQKFRHVLATEISKKSIENAKINAISNSVFNIDFVRLSADELISAFRGEKFRRLENINLNSFNFSHILLDPPRAGLGKKVCEFAKKFDNIIYISCNPISLKDDLMSICNTHKIMKFAIFDQFPNTHHIECGVLLEKLKK